MIHRRIVVLGGSGFVGRHVVSRLANLEREVVVPTRVQERGKALTMLPRVEIVQLDVRDAAAVETVARGADAVINLIGLLNETRRESFDEVHVKATETAIAACKSNGIRRLIHMSALNADPKGPSAYLRTK